MAIFEKVSKYQDSDIPMPERKTVGSAGYDFVAAEDYIIPSLTQMSTEAKAIWPVEDDEYVTTEQMAAFTKDYGFKPTLVSTGMKCKLDPGTQLQLVSRSSFPLKYWIILGNGVGTIDSDYYNNSNNEGEIFFQFINLSPFNIKINKGESIGQGVIIPFYVTEDDKASGVRTGGFGSTSQE